MTRSARKRKGMSWELIGIVAVLAIFLVFGIYSMAGSGAQGELTAPSFIVVTDESIERGVTDDGHPYLGSASAPVTVYEFADFQCPHCRNFSEAGTPELRDEYIVPGKARLVWVNNPILGDESIAAAKAAFCAAEQGKFWEYHDWLFANQASLYNSGAFSTDRLNQMAAAVEGIDTTSFADCLSTSEAADAVSRDQQFGAESNVEQTPSFLIGDTLIEGGDIAKVKEAIDAAGG
jgi:protein-disulfide isomerase